MNTAGKPFHSAFETTFAPVIKGTLVGFLFSFIAALSLVAGIEKGFRSHSFSKIAKSATVTFSISKSWFAPKLQSGRSEILVDSKEAPVTGLQQLVNRRIEKVLAKKSVAPPEVVKVTFTPNKVSKKKAAAEKIVTKKSAIAKTTSSVKSEKPATYERFEREIKWSQSRVKSKAVHTKPAAPIRGISNQAPTNPKITVKIIKAPKIDHLKAANNHPVKEVVAKSGSEESGYYDELKFSFSKSPKLKEAFQAGSVLAGLSAPKISGELASLLELSDGMKVVEREEIIEEQLQVSALPMHEPKRRKIKTVKTEKPVTFLEALNQAKEKAANKKPSQIKIINEKDMAKVVFPDKEIHTKLKLNTATQKALEDGSETFEFFLVRNKPNLNEPMKEKFIVARSKANPENLTSDGWLKSKLKIKHENFNLLPPKEELYIVAEHGGSEAAFERRLLSENPVTPFEISQFNENSEQVSQKTISFNGFSSSKRVSTLSKKSEAPVKTVQSSSKKMEKRSVWRAISIEKIPTVTASGILRSFRSHAPLKGQIGDPSTNIFASMNSQKRFIFSDVPNGSSWKVKANVPGFPVTEFYIGKGSYQFDVPMIDQGTIEAFHRKLNSSWNYETGFIIGRGSPGTIVTYSGSGEVVYLDYEQNVNLNLNAIGPSGMFAVLNAQKGSQFIFSKTKVDGEWIESSPAAVSIEPSYVLYQNLMASMSADIKGKVVNPIGGLGKDAVVSDAFVRIVGFPQEVTTNEFGEFEFSQFPVSEGQPILIEVSKAGFYKHLFYWTPKEFNEGMTIKKTLPLRPMSYHNGIAKEAEQLLSDGNLGVYEGVMGVNQGLELDLSPLSDPQMKPMSYYFEKDGSLNPKFQETDFKQGRFVFFNIPNGEAHLTATDTKGNVVWMERVFIQPSTITVKLQ